jgi:hypothetical protein
MSTSKSPWRGQGSGVDPSGCCSSGTGPIHRMTASRFTLGWLLTRKLIDETQRTHQYPLVLGLILGR